MLCFILELSNESKNVFLHEDPVLMHFQQTAKFFPQLGFNQSCFHILNSCQQSPLYLQRFITVLQIVCSECGCTEERHSGFIRKCFFSSTNLEEKTCVQVTWMLNSECLCNSPATITDFIALLVTAMAYSFLHPFVESLLLWCAGHGIHFKGLFCFSWANLSLIFWVFNTAIGKRSYPLGKSQILTKE